VITLIDVFSRWGYAKASETINGAIMVAFVEEAHRHAPFTFSMLQSDHGPEFSHYFLERITARHRYSRIGKPNDNSHIERFNRTRQEECLDSIPPHVHRINAALKPYLSYYNYHRLHLGINLRTPSQLIPSY
jgi:putative transposase